MQYRHLNQSGYKQLMEKYHVGSLLAKVVCSFGYDDALLDSFFHASSYDVLHHESFTAAAAILKDAALKGRKVFIYGDYDCDGICATAIMVTLLNKMGVTNGYYIPNRFTEGYGLNLERVVQAHDKGYDIILTVDNGVSAHESLAWAKDHGMTVIVTDHHIIERDVQCDVLCHPTLLPQDYQYLCGAGVAYLLADYLGLTDDRMAILAMLATIGDVMELKGYNIQLVRRGLELLNKGLYPNVTALGDLDGNTDETGIGFNVVPKINAIGRMADVANPNQMVRFLLTDSNREIEALVEQINQVNNRRKELTRQQYQTVKGLITDDDFLLIKADGLHEGVIGSMASRLADEEKRPCIIFTDAGDYLKGSGRSIPGVNIISLMEGFRSRTVNLGGHSQACGMTIEKDMFDQLKQYIADNYVPREAFMDCIDVTVSDLSRNNLEELFSYKPFGQGRKLPLFQVNAEEVQDYRRLKNDHQLKWSLAPWLSVLSFSNNQGYDHYARAQKMEFYGNIRENTFRGVTSYSLFADDINQLEK